MGKAGTVAFGILSLILLGGLIVTINNYSEIVKNKDAIIESGKHQISMLREWLEGNITYYNSRLLHLNSTMASLCLLYTSPSPRDGLLSRMPSSA